MMEIIEETPIGITRSKTFPEGVGKAKADYYIVNLPNTTERDKLFVQLIIHNSIDGALVYVSSSEKLAIYGRTLNINKRLEELKEYISVIKYRTMYGRTATFIKLVSTDLIEKYGTIRLSEPKRIDVLRKQIKSTNKMLKNRYNTKHTRKTNKWYAKYLRSYHWTKFSRELRKTVGECQMCGSLDNLECHHKHYNTLHKETPEDVLVVCRKCHRKIHNQH